MIGKIKNYNTKHSLLPSFSLFTSIGTLLCCALPALFVTIGAGAALAGLVSTAPWLVTLSKYKIWTFSISGIAILLAGFSLLKSRNAPCPLDAAQAKACARLRSINKWVYLCSVIVWSIGFFFAFVASYVFY